MQRRLDIAGNPERWNADRMFAVKAVGLLGLAGLACCSGCAIPPASILGVGLGGTRRFFLPDVLLIQHRHQAAGEDPAGLPDALDMLTICVEAGLGFDAACQPGGAQLGGPGGRGVRPCPPGDPDRQVPGQALRSLAARTTVPELRAFASALIQAGELGIPIADVLREQAGEMRLRRRQRAEEKAQQVPVKILFPLIGCLFPALFIIVIGPGAISIMHSLFHA